jgi:hypothetical protein
MVPLVAPLAIQGGLAGAQLIAGLIAAGTNRRPDLDPLQRNIADAERIANSAQARAVYGYDPYTRNTLLNRYRGMESAAAISAREGGLTPAQVQAARVSGAMQAGAGINSVMSQDQQLMQQKQQYADSALRQVAVPRTALFDEETRRYMQRAQAANALIGAGLQNVGNLGQDLSDVVSGQQKLAQMASMGKAYSSQMLDPNYIPDASPLGKMDAPLGGAAPAAYPPAFIPQDPMVYAGGGAPLYQGAPMAPIQPAQNYYSQDWRSSVPTAPTSPIYAPWTNASSFMQAMPLWMMGAMGMP